MGNSHSKLDLNPDAYWLREDDNNGWKKYDNETAQIIETALNDAMDKKTKGLIYITLNKGPFFGQPKNIRKYECNFIVDFSNPNKPIIHNAVQKNVMTGYKRNIKRQIKSKLSEPDEKTSEVIADVNLKESMTKQQQKMNEEEKKEITSCLIHKRETNDLENEIQHHIRTASNWEYKYNELLKTKNNSLSKRNKTQADVVLYKLKKEIQISY